MAIGGGPGGGGPIGIGNSFTGPAETAEYVNDRTYAYSGSIAATNAARLLLC